MYNMDFRQLIYKAFIKDNHMFIKGEHLPCAVSHLFGVFVTGLVTAKLITNNVFEGVNPWKVVAYSLFCGCVCIYYICSVFVHIFYSSERVHKVLERIEFCTLPLLITSIFMPVCFIILWGPVGFTLFGIVCGYTFLSIFLKALPYNPRWLLYSCQVLLCSVVLYAIIALTHTIHHNGLFWLTGGGLLYAVGIMVYPYKILEIKDKPFQNHVLSHYLILLGTGCHLVFLITM